MRPDDIRARLMQPVRSEWGHSDYDLTPDARPDAPPADLPDGAEPIPGGSFAEWLEQTGRRAYAGS